MLREPLSINILPIISNTFYLIEFKCGDCVGGVSAEIMVNIALPIGDDVSMFSVYDMNEMPRLLNSSRARVKCFVDLANLSNL